MTEGQKIEIRHRLAQLHALSELTASSYAELFCAALGGFIEGTKVLLPDEVAAAVEKAGKDA
jgi:hypothetical protein